MTVIITVAEIPLDILITNIIECVSGLSMCDKIREFKSLYKNKKRTWAIDDISEFNNVDSNTKKVGLIQKLGFSYQYYTILSVCCLCAIFNMIGIDLISRYSYNPLQDQFLIILIFIVILYFFGIGKLINQYFSINDKDSYSESLTTEEEKEEIIKKRKDGLVINLNDSLLENKKNIEAYRRYLEKYEKAYKQRSENLIYYMGEKSKNKIK
jgi:hypothetical protein